MIQKTGIHHPLRLSHKDTEKFILCASVPGVAGGNEIVFHINS